ncbi:MAG: chemotaxis protein CheX [Magnetococcales bacterium]|nr:chemotaxis protein CheX [Magnetococcales bacterium]
MDELISIAVRKAIHEVAIAFLDIEIENGPFKVNTIDDSYTPPQSEATAHIGLSGGINGGVFLSAPEHVAVYISGALLGEEPDDFNDEARDGFGELANMVAGGIQTHLSEERGEINLTPPIIITHDETDSTYKGYVFSVRQYFKTAHGPFFVEIFYSLS